MACPCHSNQCSLITALDLGNHNQKIRAMASSVTTIYATVIVQEQMLNVNELE